MIPSPDGTATTEESSMNVLDTTSKKINNYNNRQDGYNRKDSSRTEEGSSNVFKPNSSLLTRFSALSDWAESTLEKNEIDISEMDAKSIEKEKQLNIISIKWMSGYVPRCVLQDLTEQAMVGRNIDSDSSRMPYSQTHDAALLFIDMSGFTKLSQMLDVENLSKVRRIILSYMQLQLG